MTEHPILFTGAMVRAILDGTKTQTRRVIKKACDITGEWAKVAHPARDGNPVFWWIAGDYGNLADVTLRNYPTGMKCPYGQAGDRLWVRETWNAASVCYDDYNGGYEAGYPLDIIPKSKPSNCALYYAAEGDDGPFRPSIHMPRWASRITLVIDEIRVQRVQEISEDDAQAEGFKMTADGPLHAHILRDG